MTITFWRSLSFFLLACVPLFFNSVEVNAQSSPAQVLVSQTAVGGNTLYSYSVTNNAGLPIVTIAVGYDTTQGAAELRAHPLGWTFDVGIPGGSATSPNGWTVDVTAVEESPFTWVEWVSDMGIPNRQTVNGFSVLVRGEDPRYKVGHFDLILSNGGHISGLLNYGAVRVSGDLNGDGKIDCLDVAIIKASFGQKFGDPDFDPIADVNRDGIIDIRDLSFVSQKLPAGTQCQ